MENIIVKKTLVLVTTFLLAVLFFVPNATAVTKVSNTENLLINAQTNDDITTINYNIGDFIESTVKINGESYSRILLEDETNILSKGAPDVPNICRSIIVPDTAKMDVRVISSTYEEYDNILIAPSKGNLLRSVNPAEVPYEFSDVYKVDNWYPENLAELGEPYIIRDFRGQVVKINPIQYNPVTRTMRFYKDIKVEVFPIGTDTINVIDREQLPSKVDTDFSQIYKGHFINYDLLERYTPVEEQGNMLIITYDAFWDAMVPFYEWKNLKGIPTEMVAVSTIGDANAIKTYIADYYNTNGLTFVLLVGDAAQVPPYMYSYAASDPSNTYVVGSDHYPDLFIGRFSAETPEQVTTQVERSIEYEQNPQVGADWYTKGVGLGSSQGPGDDNEMDYQHIRNIRTQLLGYTYTLVNELYDGSQGGEDASGNPTPTMVGVAINNGRTIVNYCGHGSPTSWGTSGYSNSNIATLVNDNMLPFVHSVACNNGEFDYGTCFAEAWLRATHNGEPTGAIGAFMSTISQSWDPPMEGQDEFNNLVVQAYTDNIKTTLGGMTANGCMSMNDKYGSDGTGETDYWTLFGDPSLQLRTDVPSEMTVIHEPDIEGGATEFDVTVTDFQGALCAISKNNLVLGYAYTDEAGFAQITFAEPIAGEEPLTLVVTGLNKIPYDAQITVHLNDPPNTPTINGPNSGKPAIPYLFTVTATDPNGDQVYYFIDWGDGNTETTATFDSGEAATATHTWSVKGSYVIKVKAVDTIGDESDWASFDFTVQKSKSSAFSFFMHILERYPNAFPILRHILGL